jgi:hypothetical protein
MGDLQTEIQSAAVYNKTRIFMNITENHSLMSYLTTLLEYKDIGACPRVH